MPWNRKTSKLAAALMATVMVLGTSACVSADEAAKAYSADLSQSVASAMSRLKFPAPWLDDAGRGLPKANDVAKKRSQPLPGFPEDARQLPEVQQQEQRAQLAEQALRQYDQAIAQADLFYFSFNSVPAKGAAAKGPQGSAKADIDHMTGVGKQVLVDLTCSMAADGLAPEEKKESEKYSTAFTYLQDQSGKAVQSVLKDRAAGLVGIPYQKRFRWGTYAYELVKDADRHVTSIQRQITGPDSTITGAYIIYARNCLAWPKK